MNPLAELESYLAKRILPESAFARYQLGDVPHRELQPYASELRRISQSYVTHDSGRNLPSPITNARSAEAYALYYSPINAAKILHLAPLLQFNGSEVSILDLGCGPGTAALAFLHVLNKRLRITCVESSSHMSDLAQRLISGWDLNDNLINVTMRTSLRHQPGTHDLVVAANVLAELDHTQAQATLEILVNAVAPGGYLLLVEPGQQQHTRRLMGLRNRIITTDPTISPIFPCTHADECPMLAQSNTDWCHDTLEWHQPPLSAQLDHLLEFNKHRIKYSAFIFKRGATPPAGLRVLTPPKKTRLGTEALVCADSFYGITRVRKSARSERTKPFEKAKVFERLLVSGPLLEDVTEDTVFTKVGHEAL